MRALWIAGLAACSYTAPPPITVDGPSPGVDAGDDARPIDAVADAVVADGAVDAPPFDPATDCPAAYNIVLAGQQSRYRAIQNTENWPTHHADCADDLAGKTHLIVFEDMAEVVALGTQPVFRFLVGHFQMANQATADAGWFTVTGDPVSDDLWLGGQPNDDGGGENGEQDRAFMNYPSGDGVQDGPASFSTNGMCECDGKPIPPAIADML